MKTSPILLSSLLIFAVSCGNSSSSKDTPAPAVSSDNAAASGTSGATTTVTDSSATAPSTPSTPAAPTSPEAPASGETQVALKLNSSTFYEFQRLQYDCGDIKVALADTQVNPFLVGVSNFVSLAASSPKRDQALVKTTIVANGQSCTNRTLFGVNPAFTQITFQESQALTDASVAACAGEKALADAAWSKAIAPFDYDIRNTPWVALHIPTDLQSKAICPSGNLRAVFAAIVN